MTEDATTSLTRGFGVLTVRSGGIRSGWFDRPLPLSRSSIVFQGFRFWWEAASASELRSSQKVRRAFSGARTNLKTSGTLSTYDHPFERTSCLLEFPSGRRFHHGNLLPAGPVRRAFLGVKNPPQSIYERDHNQEGANGAEKKHHFGYAHQDESGGHWRDYIALAGEAPESGNASRGMVDFGR